ncbi:hypothetical protein NCU05911 [Neurospora crassa OR74A]|uniref:Uncharacterized protein n=1 Tax=Neurospora crassa (strain ATCC 24698 / 74-OR23-1A / CBS 708.71 / DSM 1257 / FGSC 987) TaxID=367110 RepID=Q7S0M9_NEUCR|nr:hypothetical protein NCU05911 [Neurospora crassa OR74A]EAA28875.1 hypothetical protein NCU05911 [Neurospora crassa OR74A]|eukprot:XP_958111.1 hypothetical protein NCU05911 [Neurospora crassa OR74A]
MPPQTSVSNALTNTSDSPLIHLSPAANVIITINVINEDDPSSQSESDQPHSQPLIRLLANDTIIRSASQKFSATLLSPLEPECQQQNRLLSHPSDVWPQPPTPPKEVFLPIPDDNTDPDALRTILCVLHLRNDLVDEVPKPRELLHIALLADKYE